MTTLGNYRGYNVQRYTITINSSTEIMESKWLPVITILLTTPIVIYHHKEFDYRYSFYLDVACNVIKNKAWIKGRKWKE